MSFEAGREIGGKYTIEKELGEGGIAIVYKVSHKRLKISRALKVLKISHPKLRERLEKEAELQAQMSHPNVVSVLDVVEVDGCPGLILEYIDGLALDDWLEKYNPSLDEAKKIFLEVLDALEEAHDQGIIHRDLKPSNIMMQHTRRGWISKVCDFGLAKALEENNSSMTRTGVTMGTPAYMAPEQIRDSKNVDQRADIFSLGAIFYELLTGVQAFQGNDTLELLNSVAKIPHASIRGHLKDIPDSFEQAIDGALEKDADNRIPTCEMLRAVLLGEKPWKIDENHTIAGIDLVAEDEKISLERNKPISLPEVSLPEVSPPKASPSEAPPEEEVSNLSSIESNTPIPDADPPLPKQDTLTEFENELEQFESSYSSIDSKDQKLNIQPSLEEWEKPEQKSSMISLLILFAISLLIFGYLNKNLFLGSEEITEEKPSVLEPEKKEETPEVKSKKKSSGKKRTNPKKRNSKKQTTNKSKESPKNVPPAVNEAENKAENKVEDKVNAKEENSAKNTDNTKDTKNTVNTITPEASSEAQESQEISEKIVPEEKENERILPKAFDMNVPSHKDVRDARKEAIKDALNQLDKTEEIEEGVLATGNVIFTTFGVDDYYLKAKNGKKYKGPDVPVGVYKVMIACNKDLKLIRHIEVKKAKLTHLACTCEPTPKCGGS